MFKKIVVICLTAFLYVAVSAQNFWDEFRTKSLDVEGVKIGQKMTYDKFVAKFGKPDRYEQKNVGESGCPSIAEYYDVGGNFFSCRNNGVFGTFVLDDNRYAALTLWIPGGIRVGDKLSSLDNFKYGKPKVASWLEPKDGFVTYTLFYDYLDDLVFLSVKDGIICSISYSDPI